MELVYFSRYEIPFFPNITLVTFLITHFVTNTGGPRYMRSFYLRIHVSAIMECRPKFIICDY
jgi:hypothetical protein